MYDFGFYWDHISGFKEYVEKNLNGQTEDDFKGVLARFKEYKKDLLENIGPDSKNNTLNAFGIEFFRIYQVNEVKLKNSVKWTELARCKFWNGKKDAQNVKEKLEDNSICATSDGKWPGTYIWKFGKNEFYVGEADDIIGRLVNYNGANKGQTTNVKINNRIWQAHNKNLNKKETVELFFYSSEHHHDDVEQYIINRARKYGYTLPHNNKDNK